ncbi:MAG: response regulator [Terriglobales bacterium]
MDARILLVDDELSVRSMLKLVFETHGYVVTAAASASEAERILADQKPFDLVLTDMRMETDTAGYTVVAAAKTREHPPAIVILTAYPLLAKDWRAAGADAVVSKPSATISLLELVQELIELRRAKDKS